MGRQVAAGWLTACVVSVACAQPAAPQAVQASGLGGGAGGGASNTALPASSARTVATPAAPSPADRKVTEWLLRVHEAARGRSYTGTVVVSSAAGSLAAAKIWHTCDGVQQVERVETLTGAPRSVFRRNDQVVTFVPDQRVVRTERRESLGLFPNLLKGNEQAIAQFYTARPVGLDRVAGHDTEIVELTPRDRLRFGYRIWSERRTGLLLKLQTLDHDGRVLQQTVFSELQIDAPVRMEKLTQMMEATDGWKVERTDPVKTTAAAEGWTLREAVPGFKPVSCYRRSPAGQAPAVVQWVFSDGLASVSLFVEPADRQSARAEGVVEHDGATRMLVQRVADHWWLTAMGEVPPATLRVFAQALERKP